MSDEGEEDLTTTMPVERQCHDRAWIARVDRGDRLEISMVISCQDQNSDIRAPMVQWDLMAREGEGGVDMELLHGADHHMDLREEDTHLPQEDTVLVEDSEEVHRLLVGMAEVEEDTVLHRLV